MRALFALLLLAGCPKTVVLQAPVPTQVRVATVLESPTEGQLEERASARGAITAELQKRNFTPVPVEVHAPHHKRFEVLADGADGALLLLVESSARYSSQMNGRYRWTVDVQARLADPAQPDDAIEAKFTVPVHLLYSHQREADALVSAMPSIARRVGVLLDEWITSHQQ